MTNDTGAPWLAALEGYYGPPLTPAARSDLIAWLARRGFDGFAYSPKDDPYHREHWRMPYPPSQIEAFASLAAECGDQGLDLALSISPGLDWRRGDAAEIDALAGKLAAFRDVGVRVLGVNWDDVPGRGPELGAEHGRAVAAAIDRVGPELRWFACPVDYAVSSPTPYLAAFADELPEDVPVAWTGPSVVSATVDVALVRGLRARLGRPIWFADNYPVNDLGMSEVLHIGPYPERDPLLRQELECVTLNMMSLPLASRVGLAVGARFWREGTDPEQGWRDELDAQAPWLWPLARACRAWITDERPDRELGEWVDAALAGDQRPMRRYLEQGCRAGVPDEWVDEIGPWCEQWELEARAMTAALDLLASSPPPSIVQVWRAASTWRAAQQGGRQVFGTRFAAYPATDHVDERLVAAIGAVVTGANLTDRLWRTVLARLGSDDVEQHAAPHDPQ